MPVSPATSVPKLILTGDPGCGKTTAIRAVVERLRVVVPMTGFWTEEVLDGRRRDGFRGVTLDGRSFRLARVDLKSPFQVGPYGVDLAGLEAIGIPALEASADTRLVVLDEIGKMESFSAPFRAAVERLLEGPVPLLATVALHGVGFVKRIRHDPRVTVVKMGRDSRQAVVGELLRHLALAGIGPAAPGAVAGTRA